MFCTFATRTIIGQKTVYDILVLEVVVVVVVSDNQKS